MTGGTASAERTVAPAGRKGEWALGDPVLRAVLKIVKPGERSEKWVETLDDGVNAAIIILASDAIPGIMLTRSSLYVTWRRTSLGMVVYRFESNGPRWVELHRCTLPQTVLHGLVGQRIDRVATLPGMAGMTIVSTGTSLQQHPRLDLQIGEWRPK